MNVFDDPCYLLITILAVFTALFLRRVVQARVSLTLGFAAALQFVTSLLVASLMIVHTVAVVAYRVVQRKPAWVQSEPHVSFYGIPYDFRIYSLVLLGVLLAVLSSKGMIAANTLIHRNRRAFAESIRLNVLLVLISLPALPLQGFAIMVVIPAIAAIVVLQFARKALESQSPKTQFRSVPAAAE